MRHLHLSILCLILFSGCSVTSNEPAKTLVLSEKTPLRISFRAPDGWTGPGKGTWPSYESWGFSRGTEPDDRYISIRVDRHRPDAASEVDPSSLSDSDVEEDLKDTFENPNVETLSYLTINRREVRFRKALNVGGAQIFGETTIEGCPVSFELLANNGTILPEDEKAFFAFVQSIDVAHQKN